jgi:AraC-like DNA-binding protein
MAEGWVTMCSLEQSILNTRDARTCRARTVGKSSRAPLTLGRDVDAFALANRVEAFIRTNSSRQVKLSDLEMLTGCTAFQIIKAFRRAVGTTPHAFMIEIRIKRAIDLLKQGVTPAQAAQDVGFVDQSHLIRHFKRRCGTTPTRYLQAERRTYGATNTLESAPVLAG